MQAAMNLLSLWAKRFLLAGMAPLVAVPAPAGEVETECPMNHPERPEARLRGGECLPEGGYRWTHIPDKIIDHGNNILTAIQIYKTPDSRPLRKAKIECDYKDKSVVLVPVPSELLRCAIRYRLPVYRGLGTDGKEAWDGEWEAFRIWAVSETEEQPQPPK